MTSLTTFENYAEDPKTIDLFPHSIYDEDLTPDCGVEIDDLCTQIREACKGWGTRTKRLINVLGNASQEDRIKIALRYPEMYDKNLTEYMESENGKKTDFGVATQFLSVGPVEAECMMLDKAMSGMMPDTVLLYSILCGRSNEDMVLLKKTYYKMYTKDLSQQVTSQCSGDLKAILKAAFIAAEEEFDPDYHTKEKAIDDAEILYNAGQGRWGTDESAMAKVIMLSPPKYLKIINAVYCDKYGYNLMKAFEQEMNKNGGDAAKFTIGMKLKPFDTIATLIKKSTKGIGTNELLLTSCIIRYQDLMGYVSLAHEALFEKSIHKRVKDEVSGNYETLLITLLNKACPQE